MIQDTGIYYFTEQNLTLSMNNGDRWNLVAKEGGYFSWQEGTVTKETFEVQYAFDVFWRFAFEDYLHRCRGRGVWSTVDYTF